MLIGGSAAGSRTLVRADTVTPATKAAAASRSTLPQWVEEACIGTAYTPLEFLSLPVATQEQFVKTLHPDIALAQVTATASVGKVRTEAATGLSRAPVQSTISPGQPLAATQMLTAAASTPAKTYIEAEPDTSGGVSLNFASSGSAQVNTTAINPGNWTSDQIAALQATDFHVTTNSGIPASAVTVKNAAGQLTLTLTDSAVSQLTPTGTNITLAVTGPTATQQPLSIVVNVWRPSIQRAHVSLDLGNKSELQFMYSGYYTGSSTTTHDPMTISDARLMDVPNVNVLDNSGSTPVRIHGLYGDTDNSSPESFGPPLTSSSLLVSTNDTTEAVPGYYAIYQFDDIRHIEMTASGQTLQLSYDGYITDQSRLAAIGLDVPELVLHVESTLMPSTGNTQMAMFETVSNPKTVAGQANTLDLTNKIFFERTYDTCFTVGGGTPEDYVPIDYMPIANDGPLKGYNEGLAIRSTETTFPYTISYNFNNKNGPDAWLGSHWMQVNGWSDTDISPKEATSESINIPPHDDYGFTSLTDRGMASKQETAGSVAYDDHNGTNGDTGIAMKWSSQAVGPFAPGDQKTMVFNSQVNNSYPPVLTVDNKTLTVDQNTANASVPGTVSDENSQKVNVYYSLDKPVTPTTVPAAADRHLLDSVDYGIAAAPHDDYLPFNGTLSSSTLQAIKTAVKDNDEHTLYLYAVDVPDATQTQEMVSNIETVRINPKAQAVLHFETAAGRVLRAPVTKRGTAGTAYNFKDFAATAADVTASAATDLTGHAPLTIGTYALDQSSLPANAAGNLPDSNTGSVDITFVYKPLSLSLSVPDLKFGQHPLPQADAAYPNKGTGTFTYAAGSVSHSVQLSAALTGFKDLTHSNAAPLAQADIAFTPTGGTAVQVPAGADGDTPGTATAITGKMTSHAGTGNTIPFSAINLEVSGNAGATLKTDQYKATVMYTLTDADTTL
ncbi:hypothetical protein L248_2871 [Schleiferilactobacillus shenzhenensis LY-73]|uniref:Uncharacterized protein n=1 Tax=Schleiferilactobacillus shenzhenensis LY-73 TaxID=1231336 RepID=U4TK22_9LACO|nr:hypothetical protein L248_2871 [Schleiferilactobacillus shenzhenensis LY-73]